MHRNPAIPMHESHFRTKMNAFSVSCCRPHPGFALASCGPWATSCMLCIPDVDWSVILTELRYLLQQYCAHDVSNYRPTSSDSQLLSTIKWNCFQVSRQLSSAQNLRFFFCDWHSLLTSGDIHLWNIQSVVELLPQFVSVFDNWTHTDLHSQVNVDAIVIILSAVLLVHSYVCY